MYKTKHKPYKSVLNSLSAAMNAILLIVFFYVLALKVDVFKPLSTGFNFICVHGYINIDRSHPLTISIKKDKVSLEIPGEPIREQTLTEIGKIYNIDFSANERVHFLKDSMVNIPLAGFQNRIFDHYLDQPDSASSGISLVSDNSELFNWVKQARIANVAVNNRAVLINVKVDEQSDPLVIKRVQAILHQQRINRYHLVTPQKDSLVSIKDERYPL